MKPSPILATIRNASALPRLALLIAAAALAACGGGGGGGPPQMPPPDVNVARVVVQPVTEWDQFSGRIEAIDSVEIRPRVTGFLIGTHFREGGVVAKGDLLFTIDDREYRAAADSVRADVARAQTRAAVARTELSRSEKLAAVKAASAEELEQRRGELAQAEADVKASQARARQSELNLEFTRVTAPIAGRVGQALVRPGNLVSAGTSLLTTVVSIDPVYVAFDGDERMFLKYQALAREGVRPSSRNANNPVRVGLANEQGYPHSGEMVFIDNALDPATGTIRAKALLANADGIFTPGLFARVQLLGASSSEAMLVHDRAVLTDQDRKYVYVIGENNAAVRKDIQLGPVVDGLRIVTAGLAPGDKVVVNGTRKIFFPGMPVAPFEVPMSQPEMPRPQPAAAAADPQSP
jgi:multidrug efflux system membrane fusion protein